MIFNVRSLGAIIVLCFVHGIASHPRHENVEKTDKKAVKGKHILAESNKQKITNFDNRKHHDHALTGSVEINGGKIDGHVDIPSDLINNQENARDEQAQWNKNVPREHEGDDAITGDVKINNDSIDGEINIPRELDEQPEKGQSNADAVIGNVEINNDDIKGEISLPEGLNTQLDTEGSNDQSNADAVAGNLQINDDINGEIVVPGGLDAIVSTGSSGNYGQSNEDAVIGKVEINNDDIQGEISLPEGLDTQLDTKDNNDQSNAGAVAGNIQINDDINGEIVVPEGLDTIVSTGGIVNYGQSNEDAVSGKIEINNDDIQGEVAFSEGLDTQHGAGSNNDGPNEDAIVGNIETNDSNIQGKIILPDKFNTQLSTEDINGHPKEDDVIGNISDGIDTNAGVGIYKQNLTNNDAITGNVEMNDGNIDGTINVPEEDSHPPYFIDTAGNAHSKDEGSVTGNIEINNDNIDGEINVPDEIKARLDTGIHNNAGNISGSIEINDGSIEGTVNVQNEGKEKDGGDNYFGNKDVIGDISGAVNIDAKGSVEGEVNVGKDNDRDDPAVDDGNDNVPIKIKGGGNCWMKLNSKKYLNDLDKLDAKYKKAREEYQNQVGPEFDKQMMKVLLSTQGKAPRAIHQAQGDANTIPAGLNLGGFGMMRMRGSMLFFHRMKLRNNTKFKVDFLQTNLMEMSLVSRLNLHDLHLQGAYERTITQGKDMSVMLFIPNYGELNLLLKHVSYNMDGRLRMLNNRLMIELVNSAINAKEILLTLQKSAIGIFQYGNTSSSRVVLLKDNIEDFVDKLKCDLDLWLKDYFNDYLMYLGIVGDKNSKVQLYEKQKTIKVNEYADHAINEIKKRIRDLGAASAKLPHFTIQSVSNQKVKLKSGVLRGLDSIYRRSVALTKKKKNVRTVDTIIGFSNLKVEYKYEAVLRSGQEPLHGMLVLSADELTAHLELSQVEDSRTVDINLDTILQLKSESLTVEGPAARFIPDFQYILENPIIAIMTNILKHNIKMLKTLPRCEPRIWGVRGDKSQPTSYKGYSAVHVSSGKENEEVPYGMHDQFKDREEEFIQNDEKDRGWEDYVFSKNDSVEIEVPINGKMEKMKLDRNENFVLSKPS